MGWHGWENDPIADPAASDVMAAYEAAEQAHLSAVDCYLAGVEAWLRLHPDQNPQYAAQRAVTVILAAKVSVRLPDE